MARYTIEAEVTIETTIEPQGYLADPYIDGVEDFNAEGFSSYGNEIEETCSISLTYVTDSDESEVESEIESYLAGSLSYEGDDVSWEVTGVSINSCEKEEMDLEAAKQILRDFVSSLGNSEDHPGLVEALEVVLSAI